MQSIAEKRVARALSLLVEKDTLAAGPDTPFIEAHTILRELFPLLFSRGTWQTVDKRALLGCVSGEGGARPLVFLSHLDVAPIQSAEQWSSPPFSGEIRGGYVYGRGTLDMKGHLVALLTAMEALLEEGFSPLGDIYFAISADEEIRGGTMQHMAEILKDRGVEPAFVLDEGGAVTKLPTLTERNTALIGVAEKGRMCFVLTANGERSMETLLRAAQRLLSMHFIPRICPVTGEMLKALSVDMQGVARFCARHSAKMQSTQLRKLERTVYGRALSRTQVMMSAMQGEALRGERASITFQASILPGDGAQELLQRIERVIRDSRILVTVDVCDEPSAVSPGRGMAWDALQTAIQVHFPDVTIAPYLLTGASDARRMESICPYIYRFSPFVLPPEEMSRMHGIDERLSIENLIRGVAFFRQMLTI